MEPVRLGLGWKNNIQRFWPCNQGYYHNTTNKFIDILWFWTFDFMKSGNNIEVFQFINILSYRYNNQLTISSINSLYLLLTLVCMSFFTYFSASFPKISFLLYIHTIIYIKYPSTNPIVKKELYRDRYKNWDIYGFFLRFIRRIENKNPC